MTKQEIGKSIDSQRKTKGISKYSIVQKTGLTFTQLTAIEQAKNNYTIDSLLKYAQAVGLKIQLV